MFARTKRLTLRPGWPEDATALTAAIAHESVVMRISRAPWPYGVDDARSFLGRPMSTADMAMMITAMDLPEPRLIGCIGLHRQNGAYELGYWLTPDAWGRGYATEAGVQMIEIARIALGLTCLHAGHYADNAASARVLAKLGFTPTGRVEPQYCSALRREVPCVRLALTLDRPNPVQLAA